MLSFFYQWLSDRKGIILNRKMVFVALFAALICVSSFWTIPFLPGIPIVLKNLVIILAGALLGTWYGAAAAALFLLTGILGLPVFVNAGGIAAFISPTGGYMIGYVVGALITGLIAGRPKAQDRKPTYPYIARIVSALFLGFVAILVCGALYLVLLNMGSDTPKSNISVFLGGITPFLIGDGIKFALSIPITLTLRPVTAHYIRNR